MVAEMANTFIFMPSMFGTFDFEDVAAGTQDNQKQRRTRKKAETAVEKRPISVTQSGDTETGCAKVEQVLKIIKNVSIEVFVYTQKKSTMKIKNVDFHIKAKASKQAWFEIINIDAKHLVSFNVENKIPLIFNQPFLFDVYVNFIIEFPIHSR